MANEINFDGVTVSELYELFVDKGIDPSDASVLVSSWIYENVGKAKRVFNYAEPFPGVEPSCMPAPFVRTFVHDDWVDGEDVVQAGETPGELGFNERFHRIENDLDRLGADVAKAFTCMAAMRASLRKLLDEIRAEINRIHDAVHTGQFQTGPLVIDQVPNYMPLLDFGRFMGTTKFLDQTVSVWQTKAGTFVLPSVETMGVNVLFGPKMKGAALLSRFIHEVPEVSERFPERFPLDAFLEIFGEEELADGRTVRDVLKLLPIRSEFDNLQSMVGEVGEREAAIVRTTMGADAAVSAALGIDGTLEQIGDADLAKLGTVPSKARAALVQAGINTVGDLAKASVNQIISVMQEADVRAEPGDAAEWTAFAQTLTQLR